MSDSQFVGPGLIKGDERLLAPHYFNGRLLTAEDLQHDRRATQTRLDWLGQAVGAGVVDGLVVTKSSGTAVQITPGSGINPQGHYLRLPSMLTLSLAPAPAPGQHTDAAGVFTDCALPGPTGGGTVPGGAYLLTAVPASSLEGLAPLKDTAGDTDTPRCAARWEREGLQFKAIRLTGFDPAKLKVNANQNNLRNLLAHWCFGSKALVRLARDPFTFPGNWTGLDQAADLTPCDLPLAVFGWTGNALSFVDVWSARRRLVQPFALTAWAGLLSDKRVAVGQARFLQFQEQLDALAAGGKASTIAARTYFRFLPPAGFLPVTAQSLDPLLDTLDRSRRQFLRREVVAEEREAAAGEGGEAARARAGAAGEAVAGLTEETFQRLLARFDADFKSGVNEELRRLRQHVTTLTQQVKIIGGAAAGEAVSPGPAVDVGQPFAFDLATFFGNLLPDEIGLVDRETIDFRLQRSWYDEALDLDPPPGQPPPDIHIFVVADNLRRLRAGQLTVEDRPYVLFTKALQATTWVPYEPGANR